MKLTRDDFNKLLENINWSYEPYYKECRERMKIMDYKFKKKLEKGDNDG